MCILWTESENIGRSFTISGHGVRSWCSRTRIIPDASGIHQLSLKIPIFVLLIFSLSSVHNRKTLLNFPMSLMPDRRQSVEYSANCLFIYFYFGFFLLLIYAVPTPEKA